MDSQDVAVTAIIIIIIIIINLSLYIKERRVSLFSFRLYFCVSLSIRGKKKIIKKNPQSTVLAHLYFIIVVQRKGNSYRLDNLMLC